MRITKKIPLVKPGQKADKKRGDILRAARSCFRKNGFHQTSMQEICAAVGLGPGAVYRYFSSKQAIIEAMAHEECRAVRELEYAVQHTDDFSEAVRLMTQAFVLRHNTTADTSMMTEVYVEGMRNKRVGLIIKKAEDEWITVLATMLRTAQARGQVDTLVDARQAALFITALWDGLMIRQVFHRQSKGDTMASFFEAMLRKMLMRGSWRDKPGKSGEMSQAIDVLDSFGESDNADTRQLSLI
jgi:TetR/AcrR family transcriptional repressor of uid operon